MTSPAERSVQTLQAFFQHRHTAIAKQQHRMDTVAGMRKLLAHVVWLLVVVAGLSAYCALVFAASEPLTNAGSAALIVADAKLFKRCGEQE